MLGESVRASGDVLRVPEPVRLAARDPRLMPADAVFRGLVEDAELVADAGVRLGRIKDPAFLTALANARRVLDKDTIPPDVVVDLQKSLNAAIKDIAPITLTDLRSGWRPLQPSKHPVGTLLFGIFCFLLLLATAYTTQVYDRATALYATTLELQQARGP